MASMRQSVAEQAPIGGNGGIRGWTFIGGLRLSVGAGPVRSPAATPTMDPAQASVRTYLVFFDRDRAELTSRGRGVIAEAAAASTGVRLTRIQVSGQTDTSGAPRYNYKLSVRRAEAIAGELVRNGVPRSFITIRGFGETDPLVSTGPGVREPQNTRVEIILH